ncbi:cupin domain-containing protein [Streptomyces sp. NBC_01431]|uniref:cupin domain-containing protein n=1 Tax=Streptomyces sp. NBC_01431 TaxID=2903863 RepID=UPI002E32ED8A|nr:cupin domain-containing protein [Streptomyces sp. NBC_01431]
MPLFTLAGAPGFDRGGFAFRPLAVLSRCSTELAVRSLELAPGAQSEPHHMDREEAFVVLNGEVSASIAGKEVLAGPGDAVIVPARSVLRLHNASTHA